jgi:outer membrane protein TolC
MSSMLEEAEIALARAELHVIEARGRLSDQLAKIDRLKGSGEDALEAEQTLGLFEAYLFIIERQRDFLLRKQHPPGPTTR